MRFGLRGCQEHREMCDVKLKETADGEEYLEFNERQNQNKKRFRLPQYQTMPPKICSMMEETEAFGGQ